MIGRPTQNSSPASRQKYRFEKQNPIPAAMPDEIYAVEK